MKHVTKTLTLTAVTFSRFGTETTEDIELEHVYLPEIQMLENIANDDCRTTFVTVSNTRPEEKS